MSSTSPASRPAALAGPSRYRPPDTGTRYRRSAELDARRRGLDFSCTIAEDVPDWVESDSLRIHQILGNLLGNALKFTHEGSVNLDVRSQNSPDGSSKILFTVRIPASASPG